MSCEYTTTIEEFFELYGRGYNTIGCDDQYKIMENVLGEFRLDYATMPRNVDSFPVGNSGTDYTVNTPIRDIEGFYSSCAPKCSQCFELFENACGGKKYKLYMQPSINPHFLVKGEYNFCIDTKQLSAALPDGVQNGFVRYYKGFDLNPALGNKNIIPVPKSMLYLLKKLLAKEYSILSGDRYQGIDQMFANEFVAGMEKMKDRTARKIVKIQNPIETNAERFVSGSENYFIG